MLTVWIWWASYITPSLWLTLGITHHTCISPHRDCLLLIGCCGSRDHLAEFPLPPDNLGHPLGMGLGGGGWTKRLIIVQCAQGIWECYFFVPKCTMEVGWNMGRTVRYYRGEGTSLVTARRGCVGVKNSYIQYQLPWKTYSTSCPASL